MKRKLMTEMGTAVLTACLALSPALVSNAAPDNWNCSTTRQEDGTILMDFAEVQLTLPGDWNGKYKVKNTTNGIGFYDAKSYALWEQEIGDGGGWLFDLCYTQDWNFVDLPAYQVLGETTDGRYYFEFPSDYQAYTDDEAAIEQYNRMMEDVTWIVDNAWLKDEYLEDDANSESEDSILPQSSTAYLTEDDLIDMTAKDVQMAINEIYARHHRKFALKEVQDYFDSKDWYEGYIEAADFDINVMNVYEAQNIQFMVNYMSHMKAR